jgi:uncharacterized OB-fold protein
MPTLRSRTLALTQEIPISKTLRFWEGLKEGKVYATKCKECGEIQFPPVADCYKCPSSQVEWIELGADAEIETFTHIVIRPTSFQHHKPYTVAIGRMKEGVRVLAWLTGFKFSEVRIGMKVKLIAKTSEDGNPTYEFIRPTQK